MKTFLKIGLVVCATLLSQSCSKYLDVVPDNTMTLEDLFDTRETAYEALARVYNYIPRVDDTHLTTWSLGDEFVGRLDLNTNVGNLRAMRIMRGLQSATSPQLGTWSGTEGAKSLYDGLRQCDVFLQNINTVRDMGDLEKAEWAAQVTFLKAYYAFLLVRQYGPIVLPIEMVSPESSKEELFLPRSKVDDCFNYVLALMDEAIPNLTERTTESNMGQVDQVAAKAIKARVLFYRASPFFNGNQEYFGDFVDRDGQPFFPLQYDNEKWKQALDAINESIALCEQNGLGLYHFEKEPFIYDREAFAANEENM